MSHQAQTRPCPGWFFHAGASRRARPADRHRPGRDGFAVVPLWWHPRRFGSTNWSKEKQEQSRLHLGAVPASPVGSQHRRHLRISRRLGELPLCVSHARDGAPGAAGARRPKGARYPRQCPAPRQTGHDGLGDPPAGPQGPAGFGGVPRRGGEGLGSRREAGRRGRAEGWHREDPRGAAVC